MVFDFAVCPFILVQIGEEAQKRPIREHRNGRFAFYLFLNRLWHHPDKTKPFFGNAH